MILYKLSLEMIDKGCHDNIRLGCNFVTMMKRQTYEGIWKKLEKYKQMVFDSEFRFWFMVLSIDVS